MHTQKIMLVDDEPNALAGYVRNLRKEYDLTTCNSGREALDAIAQKGPFAVVVSDMRMPEMSGLELLTQLKQCAPKTVRLMLTGNSDQKTAIDAVNEGDVFRFLNKPCSPEEMGASLKGALEQHRLICAERDLLEHTLRGSIAAMSEVLSLVRPQIYGRTNQYREDIILVAQELGIPESWALGPTALFSLVGTVALPDDLVERALSGTSLSDEEQASFDAHPAAGHAVLSKIPRIEDIAESIRYQLKNFDGSGVPHDSISGESIPAGARMLRVIMYLDSLERSGMPTADALTAISATSGLFDPAIVKALTHVRNEKLKEEIVEIPIKHALNGMTLAQDVKTLSGTLLITRGQELTDSVRERLTNFASKGTVASTIVVKLGKAA